MFAQLDIEILKMVIMTARHFKSIAILENFYTSFFSLLRIQNLNMGMKISAEKLYKKLVNDYKLVGQTGRITFTLKDITLKIETKDTVGNLIQEWLKEWMKSEKIDFQENPQS